jgi:menaquinone-dependent protoporphyrinogen IX oxidase
MHYSHVKRKETTMKAKRVTNLKLDPETLAVLNGRARKARSEYVNSFVVRLISRLTPRLHLRRLGAHWG